MCKEMCLFALLKKQSFRDLLTTLNWQKYQGGHIYPQQPSHTLTYVENELQQPSQWSRTFPSQQKYGPAQK